MIRFFALRSMPVGVTFVKFTGSVNYRFRCVADLPRNLTFILNSFVETGFEATLEILLGKTSL